jgi:hypothetical protein
MTMTFVRHIQRRVQRAVVAIWLEITTVSPNDLARFTFLR